MKKCYHFLCTAIGSTIMNFYRAQLLFSRKKTRIPNFNKKFHVKILKVLKRILRINSPIRRSFAFFSFIVMVLYIRNKLIASDLKKFRIGRFGIGCWIPWARYLRIFLSGMLLLSLNLSLGYCWLTFDKFITL